MIMTEGEITSSYRQAKDPKGQIRVLAELNACKRKEIREILRRHGYEVEEAEAKRVGNWKRGWEDEEIDRVERLCEEGLSLEEVCEAVGRTKAAVTSMIYRERELGREFRTDWSCGRRRSYMGWNADERRAAREMAERGESLIEIAEEMNRTEESVRCMLRKTKKGGEIE